ncbi:MAG TPA: Holliday junction resolvase RuvX [Caulobacteraceae bacterium]|jgi:putative Holliday junction resolvase|nr:Holliday junction resolvase RuvX [Caulobacteraceae bacterium]
MAVIDLLALPDSLPRGAAIVGLDLGEKTIGVAVSDVSHLVATPAQTLKRVKFTRDAGALFALMAERGAAGLVIGLPVNMDGTEGPRSQSARAFARNLLRLRDLPIAFWDERLSTVAVSRALIDEADLSRSKRAAAIDKLAAAWILQGALDRLRAAKRDPTTAL